MPGLECTFTREICGSRVCHGRSNANLPTCMARCMVEAQFRPSLDSVLNLGGWLHWRKFCNQLAMSVRFICWLQTRLAARRINIEFDRRELFCLLCFSLHLTPPVTDLDICPNADT